MPRTKKEQRHRGNRKKHYSEPNPIDSDPISRYWIPQLGGIIEYLDSSCTAAVDSIKFSSDGSTILGRDDLDTADLESAYSDDIGTFYSQSTKHGSTNLGGDGLDTVDSESAYSEDIGTFYSQSTMQQDCGDTDVGDISTADFHSTGSIPGHNPSRSIEQSSKRTVGAAKKNVVLIGRLHPKVPETNISLKKGNTASGEDCSIVTVPTDTTYDSEAILAHLQNSALDEMKQELATAEQTRSEPEKSEGQVEPEASCPEPETTPSKVNISAIPTVGREQEAVIEQGLQLCRRIQQSIQRQTSSKPLLNGDSSALRGFPSPNDRVANVTENTNRTTTPAPNEDISKPHKNSELTDQSPAAAPARGTRLQQSTPVPPKAQPTKRKSAGISLVQKTNFLKGKIQLGYRKASF